MSWWSLLGGCGGDNGSGCGGGSDSECGGGSGSGYDGDSDNYYHCIDDASVKYFPS